MNGAELIANERQRQIEVEGWDEAHDQQEHGGWELVYAAVSYLLNKSGLVAVPGEVKGAVSPVSWPWADQFWKPTPDNRVKELTKAGALIAAEIDRLQASEGEGAETGGQS